MDSRKGYRGYSKQTIKQIHQKMKDQKKPERGQKGKGKWIPAHRTASGVRFGYWSKGKEERDG